jgi:L-seryl-tRNA(Ser) seleniumtransferase
MPDYPPSMDRLLSDPRAAALVERCGASEAKAVIKEALDQLRTRWRGGGETPSASGIFDRAAELAGERFTAPLRRVVNATGVVLHTNLGRAPLPPKALQEASSLLTGYVDLETDIASGRRGHRDSRVESAFQHYFETDHAVVVVNNNAAAVLLALNTLALGKEVVVSRGELVEIGGGFRIPEIMGASGAVLREVGTTNRTSLDDYRRAASRETGLLLKVHPSNYRVLGFSREVPLVKMVALGRSLGLPVLYDLGSGLAAPDEILSLGDEPPVRQALSCDPDVLCFSADKLFGACQAGILLIRKNLADRFRRNPLLRALRVDKTAYHMLGAVLNAYRRGRFDEIPALSMLRAAAPVLRRRARRLLKSIEQAAPGAFELAVVNAEGRAGGGSAPLFPLVSPAVKVKPLKRTVEEMEYDLRTGGEPPVVTVLEDGAAYFHLRTLSARDAGAVVSRLAQFASQEVQK